MSDKEWVPPRWYLKKVPREIKEQMFGKPAKPGKKKGRKTQRLLNEPDQAPAQVVDTADIVAAIKIDSDRAMALLSEFGLSGTHMRKNVR